MRVAHRGQWGLVLFPLLTFLGSWTVAIVLRIFELNVAPGALGTRLLATSLLYGATMGWQPLVATFVVRRWVDLPGYVDLGLRTARRGFNVIDACGALGLVAAAMWVAHVGGLGATTEVELEPSLHRHC